MQPLQQRSRLQPIRVTPILDLLPKGGEFPVSNEELDDKATRYTKEFQDEAVRPVQTSGRTQREIASELGIALSTLVRLSGRSRDRRAVDPSAAASDVTTEWQRLRRKNGILRQERVIPKEATAFFAPEGSR
jgi:transposase